MRVYLAEKKSQGHDLADVLNQGRAYDDRGSYIVLDGGDVVTWCAGHLLELAEPQDYDPKYRFWKIEDLPIFPEHWQWLPRKKSMGQLKVIAQLLHEADEAVIASDYDREGQLLAVNVLNHCNFRGRRLRIRLTATDRTSITRAVNGMEDLEKSMSLYRSAVARSHGDWLVGFNATRAFSCLASSGGRHEVVNLGRVITPTACLVYERDRQIAEFKPKDYYEIETQIAVQNGSFRAQWIPPEEACDPDGHCIDRLRAEAVLNRIKGKNLVVTAVDRTKSHENPPLPFSQSRLQIYAARHFGYRPEITLEISQALYDSRHKLTTYPRTDCSYLPVSQLEDAPRILAELAKDPALAGIIAGCDPKRKSRAFSDKKMEGHPHNAIIPSLGPQSTEGLSAEELAVYNIIRLYYIAQFYAPAEYDVVTVKAECEGEHFIARGRTLVKPGYRVIFHENELDDPEEEEAKNSGKEKEPVSDARLIPPIATGERGYVAKADFLSKKTRAPKHFDNASLIEAMSHIAKYITDPEQKKVLTDTNGLGTEATRSGIIENLLKYGWISDEKGHFEATEKTARIMKALPEEIKSPGMTAVWEKSLDDIVRFDGDDAAFEIGICSWMEKIIDACRNPVTRDQMIRQLVSGTEQSAPQFKCEKCGGALRRIRGQYGYFWKCQNGQCGQTFQDEKARPVPLFNPESAPKCPFCGGPLKRFQKKAGGHFWKCQNENCGAFIDDNRGRPQMPEKCPACGDFIIRHKGKFGFFWKCRNAQCGKTYDDLQGKPVTVIPVCPKCGKPMRLITRRRTGESIEPFFACTDRSCGCTLDKNGKKPAKESK